MPNLARTSRSRIPWTPIAKAMTPPFIWNALYKNLIVGDIPDAGLYRPHYAPWTAPEFAARFAAIRPYTEVFPASCWTLAQMLAQALHLPGDVMEAGVYRGGTAKLLKDGMRGANDRQLLLFDSFEGMQAARDGLDRHRAGDFADTSLEAVQALVGDEDFIVYRKGWIPETFAGLEDRRLAFVHIDLDLYQSILDCLAFVYPRLSPGGVLVFDDYGFASCPGARRAVDEFFGSKPERPLGLQTGQALVIKL